jgi:hypothetical protein
MVGLMADNDVQGQFEELRKLLRSETWRELWEKLGLIFLRLQDVGLTRESSDLVVWQTCQQREIILFTGNRNQEGPESLETAIRLYNQADSLPVITLSNPKRFRRDRRYAHKVAERLLGILQKLDNHRGAGRLWVP